MKKNKYKKRKNLLKKMNLLTNFLMSHWIRTRVAATQIQIRTTTHFKLSQLNLIYKVFYFPCNSFQKIKMTSEPLYCFLKNENDKSNRDKSENKNKKNYNTRFILPLYSWFQF